MFLAQPVPNLRLDSHILRTENRSTKICEFGTYLPVNTTNGCTWVGVPDINNEISDVSQEIICVYVPEFTT